MTDVLVEEFSSVSLVGFFCLHLPYNISGNQVHRFLALESVPSVRAKSIF